ncbi:MAG: cysteine--tRNA ligase [Bacilli bacterium]|nr:cysteine--tRNA ligase [Bacilli bacterium]
MSLKVYNVLTKTKEEFIPQEKGKVKMYACGITASGDAHIGHAYQAIVFDMIKKYLEYSGYEVTYVRNYTDVDDKIIIRARELGVSPKDYAEAIMKKTDTELSLLSVDPPTIQSKATECIQDMIDVIDILIKKGHAYATDNGDVFFSVDSFSEYGKFSNRIVGDGLSGVRKEVEPGKRDDKDFALWKNAKADEIFWNSPWGKGRPGWHIECSVMSIKYLGETLDIHGGGKDLVFPHHENEIAQSEALTGKRFSNYWMHNGLIKINGLKMGKSLGNSILIEDLLKRYNYEVIRMTLLQNHYRSDMNVIDGMFELNEEKIYGIYKLFDVIDTIGKDYVADTSSEILDKIEKDFQNVMDNDFNTALAMANLFGYINEMTNKLNKKTAIQELVNMKYALIKVYGTLGFLQQSPQIVVSQIREKYISFNNISEQEISELIERRKFLKSERNYEGADLIRNKLLARGIIIKDTREGTEWDIDSRSISKKKIK